MSSDVERKLSRDLYTQVFIIEMKVVKKEGNVIEDEENRRDRERILKRRG